MDWGLGVPDMSHPITRPPPSSRVVQFGTSAVLSFSDDLPLGDAVWKDATSATAIITRPKAAASPATRKPDIWPGCAFSAALAAPRTEGVLFIIPDPRCLFSKWVCLRVKFVKSS
jgi:hypothetical protein